MHMTATERDENKTYKKQFLERITKKLPRALIDTLLSRYIFHLNIQGVLFTKLNDEDASALLTDVMTDIVILQALRDKSDDSLPRLNKSLKQKASAQFWNLLCDDNHLLAELHMALLLCAKGTFTEIRLLIVDSFFPPDARSWQDRSFVLPTATPVDIQNSAYYIGCGCIFPSGRHISYGDQGIVLTEPDKPIVDLEIYGRVLQVNTKELSRVRPPPLLGGVHPREKFYFQGEQQSFRSGTVLRFGDCGQVIGPAKQKRMMKSALAVYFPGKKCIIDCFLSQASVRPKLMYESRRESRRASHTPSFCFVAQLSPFPPSRMQLNNELLKRDQQNRADAIMSELVKQEEEEKEAKAQKAKEAKEKRARAKERRAKEDKEWEEQATHEHDSQATETAPSHGLDCTDADARCTFHFDPVQPAAMQVFSWTGAVSEASERGEEEHEEEHDEPKVVTVVESSSSTVQTYIENFLCPITTEVMTDPVVAESGFTYERSAIEAWFKKNRIDPTTGEEVSTTKLIPNFTLRAMIREKGLI